MLQLNHQQLPPPQENPYAMLTRQSSAPPLGQRSPSN
ncbi:unnamed protein product, partial [Rotaria magnacalcarata]